MLASSHRQPFEMHGPCLWTCGQLVVLERKKWPLLPRMLHMSRCRFIWTPSWYLEDTHLYIDEPIGK